MLARAISQPHYVLGRFLTVRRVYGRLKAIGERRTAGITIAPLYERVGRMASLAQSGLVRSDRSVADHVACLEQKAWSDGVRLTPEAIAGLRSFAESNPLRFRRAPDEFNEVEKLAALSPQERGVIALASVKTAWADPFVRRLAADATLIEVVTAYLGYQPTIVTPYLFWSFANRLSDAERIARMQTIEYHFDVQGYNFAYVSFYLVDTDAKNGAHVLIEGSHRDKAIGDLLGSAKLTDVEALARYGKERVVTVERSAGEGFFEDTSCFHKALPPIARDRLMLQLRYL